MLLILKQHVWIQKDLLEGDQLWRFLGVFFFFVDEGREDPNTTKKGTSSAHQQNAI